MVTDFEEITSELTVDELGLVDLVIKGFSKYSKERQIKSDAVIKGLNGYISKHSNLPQIKMTGVRLRKIINYIRVNSISPIIGTSEGYYISQEQVEIEKQIRSLEQRAQSIQNCADGLRLLII